MFFPAVREVHLLLLRLGSRLCCGDLVHCCGRLVSETSRCDVLVMDLKITMERVDSTAKEVLLPRRGLSNSYSGGSWIMACLVLELLKPVFP